MNDIINIETCEKFDTFDEMKEIVDDYGKDEQGFDIKHHRTKIFHLFNISLTNLSLSNLTIRKLLFFLGFLFLFLIPILQTFYIMLKKLRPRNGSNIRPAG